MSVLCGGRILLPKTGIDLAKWSVVACDQYTSSPEYWEQVKAYVGDSPSALNLICPEAYLAETESRAESIRAASEYYAENVLVTHDGMILVRRTTKSGERWGLVCLADLEAYSYEKDNSALIRATEGTVVERIPPRLKVRRASRLDVPHVLCLIDDEKRSVIEPLAGKGSKLYDVTLAFGGGRLEGWLIEDISSVSKALDALEKESQASGKPFVLVGDGNHSLASAKAYYEELKAAGDPRAAKARYALVETENLRSGAIVFEPIHRIIYNKDSCNANGCSINKFAEFLKRESGGEAERKLFAGSREDVFCSLESEIGTYRVVQALIDRYLAENPSASVDYIHGESELRRLCAEKGAVGVVMPGISKSEFFSYVTEHGSLPRKTFSMGEAYEKRYYMETRDLF